MNPTQKLASISQRLARGNRVVGIPARGNADEFGIIANSFVEWSNSLEITEELREELEKSRSKLESTLMRITESRQIASTQTRDSLSTEEDPSTYFSEIPPFPEISKKLQSSETSSNLEEDDNTPGSLSTASQQLQNFTHFESSAANSVERTESLIGGLNETNQLVAKIAELIINIRSQIDHLTFENLIEHQTAEDNLTRLNEPKTKLQNFLLEKSLVKRLESLQQTANRTDRTLTDLRTHLDRVKVTAQEIAASASSQAIEATGKLLQTMLDNLLIKMEKISNNRDKSQQLSHSQSNGSFIKYSPDKKLT